MDSPTDNHTILVYKKYQTSCLTSTIFWDAILAYWFANVDAINVMSSAKFTYLKDVEAVCSLRYEMPHPSPVRSSQYVWSQHGLEGAEWKRHWAITKTAFNEANNAFVWQETIRIVNEWFIDLDDKAASSNGAETSVSVAT